MTFLPLILSAKASEKPAKPVQVKTPTKSSSEKNSRTNSKDSLAEDNISQTSLGGGIKGKLAALFNKEQTISETTIANKFKQERDKEMAMLQNRFHYKKPQKDENESDDDNHSEHEGAPLMGSTASIAQVNKKPEIVANIPKVVHENRDEKEEEKVIGSQPVKRRSSQDSQIVLNVLDEVKRIKVNGNNNKENGAVVQQPKSLYPHLSDIESDHSKSQEEYSDCGGSRCGHYVLECICFFMCI